MTPSYFVFDFDFFFLIMQFFNRFAARLLAIFLNRVVGVSVAFRVAGCNCLRDVIVQFKKVFLLSFLPCL